MLFKVCFTLQSVLLVWVSVLYLQTQSAVPAESLVCVIDTGEVLETPTLAVPVEAESPDEGQVNRSEPEQATQVVVSSPASQQTGEVPDDTGQSKENAAGAKELFVDEQIDHAWAPEFSQQLGVMFQQNARLNDLKIKDIDCRSSLCRVQLYTEGAQSLAVGIKIGAALTETGFTDNAYQFDAATDDGLLTIYVGRSAQSFAIE